jgi:hypothetical protein
MLASGESFLLTIALAIIIRSSYGLIAARGAGVPNYCTFGVTQGQLVILFRNCNHKAPSLFGDLGAFWGMIRRLAGCCLCGDCWPDSPHAMRRTKQSQISHRSLLPWTCLATLILSRHHETRSPRLIFHFFLDTSPDGTMEVS